MFKQKFTQILCQKSIQIYRKNKKYDHQSTTLGFTDNIPGTFDLLFRGRTYEAVMSPLKHNGQIGHYHDINLIGATFLTDSRTKLTIDYNEKNITMEFK